MEYYISDLHLGHRNVLDFERRNFKTIQEHDDFILNMLKQTLGKDDTLYCLGDIGFPSDEQVEIFKNLPCKKVLIMGNHDKKNATYYFTKMGFNEVYKHPVWLHKRIVLSHYPIPVEKSILNIHGHLHSSTIDMNNYMNANIHMTNYKLLSYKQAMDKVCTLETSNYRFLQEWYAGHQKYTDEEIAIRTDLIFNENGIAIGKKTVEKEKGDELEK